MSEHDPREEHDHEQQHGEQGATGRASLADLYDRMSRVLRDNLERAGTFTEDAFERGLKESRDWAHRMREHYSGDISRVSEALRRDWLNAIRHTRDQTRRSIDLDRMQAGALGLLSRLARSAGSQLESFANRINERLTYKTGEIAGTGALECTGCGQVLDFDKPTRVPPCPKCHGTAFRRSF